LNLGYLGDVKKLEENPYSQKLLVKASKGLKLLLPTQPATLPENHPLLQPQVNKQDFQIVLQECPN